MRLGHSWGGMRLGHSWGGMRLGHSWGGMRLGHSWGGMRLGHSWGGMRLGHSCRPYVGWLKLFSYWNFIIYSYLFIFIIMSYLGSMMPPCRYTQSS